MTFLILKQFCLFCIFVGSSVIADHAVAWAQDVPSNPLRPEIRQRDGKGAETLAEGKSNVLSEAQGAAEKLDEKLTAEELKAIEIDPESKEPIFVFDQSGGRGLRYGSTRSPLIRVFADGRVVTGGTTAVVEKLEARLTDSELKQFLHFLVNENKFFDIDSKKIEDRFKAAKTNAMTRNGIYTKAAITLKNRKHSFSIYSFDLFEEFFKDWVEVGQIRSIRNRCMALNAKIHIGELGDDVVKRVNEELKKQAPEIAPFEVAEIVTAQRLKKGRFQVRFSRQIGTAPQDVLHGIYFIKDEKSEPSIMLLGVPKKQPVQPQGDNVEDK